MDKKKQQINEKKGLKIKENVGKEGQRNKEEWKQTENKYKMGGLSPTLPITTLMVNDVNILVGEQRLSHLTKLRRCKYMLYLKKPTLIIMTERG